MLRQNILRSTALLTLSGIFAKTVDFLFRAYYSTRLGSEGMGLFSLVFSFHGLILTVATAGLGVAVSKTVSQHFVKKELGSIKKTMKIALGGVIALSLIVIFFVWGFSEKISASFLKEPRTRQSLLLLSPSILFMSISYCIKGYFYACRRVLIPASSEFLEQAVKIFTIVRLLNNWLPYGIEKGCEAVFLGITIGEFFSCFYLTLFFLHNFHKLKAPTSQSKALMPLLRIATPSMLSSLSGSYLRMQEDVFIIDGLRRSGLSHTLALSQYGSIKGMVMPLVVFPLTLLSSFLTLLVPEISRAASMKSSLRLKTLISRIYRFTTLGGFLMLTLFFIFSEELSRWVYSAPEISTQVRIISLLSPIMFIDSVSSGILGGMGKQTTLLFLSLCDSGLRLVFIKLFVPKFGINALIVIIILSNLFTAYHSSSSALRSAKTSPRLWGMFLAQLLSSFAAIITCREAFYILPQSGSLALPLLMLSVASVYIFFSSLLYKSMREDMRWFFGRMIFDASYT